MRQNGETEEKSGGKSKITFASELEEVVFTLKKENCIFFLLPDIINKQVAGYKIYSQGPTLVFSKDGRLFHIET